MSIVSILLTSPLDVGQPRVANLVSDFFSSPYGVASVFLSGVVTNAIATSIIGYKVWYVIEKHFRLV